MRENREKKSIMERKHQSSFHKDAAPPDYFRLMLSSLGNDGFGKLIQGKMDIGSPGDQYEQAVEAWMPTCRGGLDVRERPDKIADQIVEQYSGILDVPQKVDKVQASGGAGLSVPKETEAGIKSLEGNGSIFSKPLRDFYEPHFGDLYRLPPSMAPSVLDHPWSSKMRLHTGRQANKLNESIGAQAFTYGNNIAFKEGEFQPETKEGKKLIAHELTHVAQQTGGVQKRDVVQRAEWFVNKNEVGVRDWGLVDVPCDLPLVGTGIRGLARLFGMKDVDTDHLPVISQWDETTKKIEKLTKDDYIDAALLVLGIILSSYQALNTAKSFTTLGPEFLKAMFGPGNPLNETEILLGINTILTDYGYIGPAVNTLSDVTKEILDFLNKTDIKDKILQSELKDIFLGILNQTNLYDLKWYPSNMENWANIRRPGTDRSYQELDNAIAHMAEKANIPIKVPNEWGGIDDGKARNVARQMMRNYMFLGEMIYEHNITDINVLKLLFWGCPGKKEAFMYEDMSEGPAEGPVSYEWYKGFVDYNKGTYDFFKMMGNDEYVKEILELKKMVTEINGYYENAYLYYSKDPQLKEKHMDQFEERNQDGGSQFKIFEWRNLKKYTCILAGCLRQPRENFYPGRPECH